MYNLLNNTRDNRGSDYIISSLGLCLIGFFSIGYSLFGARFAELHIQLFFLDFPVFAGEILLFFCLILLLMKWKKVPLKFSRWHYLLLFYFAFVVTKALWGYLGPPKWGPLALRHSALFYYPSFAIFGYAFYRRNFFNKYVILILSLFLIVAPRVVIPKLLINFYDFFSFTCFILAFVSIKAYPDKTTRYILFFLLLVFAPYKSFFQGSRATLVSNVAALVFIFTALVSMLRIRLRFKTLILGFCLCFLVLGVFKMGYIQEIISILDIDSLKKRYAAENKTIEQEENNYKMQEIKVAIYNPQTKPQKAQLGVTDVIVPQLEEDEAVSSKELRFNIDKVEKILDTYQEQILNTEPSEGKKVKQDLLQRLQTETQKIQISLDKIKSQSIEKDLVQEGKETLAQVEKLLSKEPIVRRKGSERSVSSAQGTSIFRILVWKDALIDLMNEKPILGFDFGKPFRSRSIEIANLAYGEWSRDGWIEFHNSYLQIIYRAGIVGMLYILCIILILVGMVKKAICLKTVTGILLCGALVSLLVSANFAVILELPYNAIPLWALLGMSLAYLSNINRTGEG